MSNFRSFLYDTRSRMVTTTRVVNVVASVSAFILIIYEIGFPMNVVRLKGIQFGFDIIFGLFAASYFVRIFYSFERWKLIKATWFEFFLMLLIIVIGIANLIQDGNVFEMLFQSWDVEKYQEIYTGFITLYMSYLIGFQFVKASSYLTFLAIKPATTFIFSFILLIFVGAGFLMLPEMTTVKGGAPFLEAFFTSTSASCVTGLIIVDTATYWSFKGHLVLMFLMQLGGIGIVSFATFFTTFLKSGVGIKQQRIIQDFLLSESLHSARGLLRQVIHITVFIEAIAAVLIFFTWGSGVQFDGIGQKVFYSIFHAVSAFCNAGFSLFSNGLNESALQGSQILHIVIALTIILGGLGFSTIQDVFSPKALRERLDKPWKEWKLSTKIAIHTSGVLTILGMLVYILVERDNPNTVGGMGNFETMVSAFFQSVTTRTAGFNTIDFGDLKQPTLLFFIFLMFIGASSGSTGGGIKTSTFLLISISSFAMIRGKQQVDLGKRTISPELISKAMSILAFAIFYNFFMIFLLTLTDPSIDFVQIAFEEVSAFATVGLSTGITADLSLSGKSLIIFTMFIGRIGTLTLLLALSSRVVTTNYKYPNAHLMVG